MNQALNPISAWQAQWSRLAARERAGVALAAVALALAALWWLALAPALRTVQDAPAQKARLQSQLDAMQAQAAQAKAMQTQPKLGREDTARALADLVRQRLGNTAQVSVQGERAVLTLKGTPAQALAQWLAAARVQSRVAPEQAQLQRSAAGAALWDGSLVLALPTQTPRGPAAP